MTSYDLIWQLIELILKDKKMKSNADDKNKDLEIIDKSVSLALLFFIL